MPWCSFAIKPPKACWVNQRVGSAQWYMTQSAAHNRL
ncbi:unnamed protein product [Chondrus crispus]|uniref:Uncharacterized protein n=1 Tax=Chondrus crispus TaxID=2769 RepID=R7QG01_CHOCR|nr:unnamed protein product [Chondrus crispus]CDF36698.1 unnamed protein product [Chondrus crispus]|eukprot:XP_005716517.1 unnamed protein product [Chondrus crispus]